LIGTHGGLSNLQERDREREREKRDRDRQRDTQREKEKEREEERETAERENNSYTLFLFQEISALFASIGCNNFSFEKYLKIGNKVHSLSLLSSPFLSLSEFSFFFF
jgi:hypothetical protein